MTDYKQKYLKYKTKYLIGSGISSSKFKNFNNSFDNNITPSSHTQPKQNLSPFLIPLNVNKHLPCPQCPVCHNSKCLTKFNTNKYECSDCKRKYILTKKNENNLNNLNNLNNNSNVVWYTEPTSLSSSLEFSPSPRASSLEFSPSPRASSLEFSPSYKCPVCNNSNCNCTDCEEVEIPKHNFNVYSNTTPKQCQVCRNSKCKCKSCAKNNIEEFNAFG